MDLAFDVMFHESRTDAYIQYGGNIKRFIVNILKINDSLVTLQEKKEEHLYRGELSSNIFRFVGNVKIDGRQERKLLDLISEYCLRRELDNSLIAFNSSVFNDFKLLKTHLRSLNTRNLHSLAFGTLVDLKKFVPHIRVADRNANPHLANNHDIWTQKIQAKFEHYKKRLLIEVETQNRYRFILEYSAINYIIISKIDNFWTIYLVLSTPALLYEVKRVEVRRRFVFLEPPEEEADGTEEEEEEYHETEDQKVRYTKAVRELRRTTLSSSTEPAVFTKSNVLELSPLSRININPESYFKAIWEIVSNVNRYAKTPVYIGRIQQHGGSLGDVKLPIPQNLPFNVHYAFECLVNASYQLHDELYVSGGRRSSEFVNKVHCLCALDSQATEEALFDLFWIKDNNIPVDSFYALDNRFNERRKFASFRSTHEHLVEIRRCILTPTRVVLLPPLPYQKSRMLRISDPDLALRVYAKDDNFNELNFTVLFPGTPDHCREFLHQFLLSKWILGIELGGRRYEFLGSSTSQLRDIGMMFYASDTNGINANIMRQNIGDLSHIKCPAKYIARLGQAFSQPIAYKEQIDSKFVTVEPDVTGGYNRFSGQPYVFSDGVGMISEHLAIELTALVNKKRLIPYSAFQIRHGGSKGMVTLNPNLPGTRMILRDSMKKFESSLTSIEVLKVTEPRYVHLNRPFVNILEQLGVDSRVFLTIARKDFQRIIDSFSCKCKALEVIKNFSHLPLDYDALRDCGIDVFGELYFRKTLEAVIRHTIKLVKSNARIRLPESYGRTMLGVMDDTRTLEEGQVFVQYSMFDDYLQRKIVTGEILVTKFPCMHPGDVRKFIAVDVPQLRHLCDCIVFPQKGSRPHPDQMAGSDLDGDEYAIIWEKSFIFPGKNHDAMEYPSGGSGNVVHQVGVVDMLQFYVDFIQKNTVGVIANSHLALSDQLPDGIFDEKCIVLAKQHPIALDYAKSGQLHMEKSPRAHFYPDFMEKSESKPTYKSKRALGKLFRLCCLLEENAEFDSILEEELCGNERLLTYPGWNAYETDAQLAYSKYKSRILQIQRQFGIENQLSLLSGVYTKIQKYVSSKNERKDVIEMINMLVREMREEFRTLFFKGVNNSNTEIDRRKQMAKASAWYIVTIRLNKDDPNPLYGLPWILSDILCDVAVHNSKGVRKHECVLDVDVYGEGIPIHTAELRGCLSIWLENSLKSFRGFQLFYGTVQEKYREIIEPIVDGLRGINRLDIAMQRVLKQLSASLESEDEFENMLALSASMTLRRFRRTKKLESFTQSFNVKDTEKETWITCLSMKDVNFRSFVYTNSRILFKKLRDSGVEDVCCHVTQSNYPDNSLLFISAFGKRECLKKLKNALTREEFYKDIIYYTALSFD